jgi:hypothetical protein
MLHNIHKPEISERFDLEDIHKIRDWHYEILKDATGAERRDFYNHGALCCTGRPMEQAAVQSTS